MNVNTQQDDTGVVKGNFKSCTLVREVETGVVSNTVLLPEKFAKAGKNIEINTDGVWTQWMVLKASGSIVVDPIDPRILIKAHRRATGDSMKRVAPTKGKA